MEQIMAQMLGQLSKEQNAEDNGQPLPDMPDISKLISQVTKSMMQNDDLKGMIQHTGRTHVPINSNKPKLIVHKVVVSLHDLYTGCLKSLKMRRQVYNPETDRHDWEKTKIDVTITRGMRFNDKILVEGVGDVLKDKEPGDLEVVLVEDTSDTSIFTISDDDLQLKLEIPLCDLFQYVAEIEHLDGQKYPLFYSSNTVPLTGAFKVNDLGLPKEDGTFGDLLIDASVKFPASRTELEVLSWTPATLATDDDCIIRERK